MTETWLPVPDYPSYEASDLGRIRNVKSNRVLNPKPTATGTSMNKATRKRIITTLRAAADILSADFAAIPHFKNKWRRMTVQDLKKDPQLQEELFELVRTAYKPIGGHLNIRRPSDLMNGGIAFFDVVDIDSDADADAVSMVKKKAAGEKHVGMGHDGTKPAKTEILKHKSADLKKPGFFAEVSDAIAHILLTRYHTDTVNDESTVRKVLKGKDIEWVGAHPSGKYPKNAGWYFRKIAGKKHMKIMVGHPKT